MKAAMDRTENDHYHLLSVGEAGKDVETLDQVSLAPHWGLAMMYFVGFRNLHVS